MIQEVNPERKIWLNKLKSRFLSSSRNLFWWFFPANWYKNWMQALIALLEHALADNCRHSLNENWVLRSVVVVHLGIHLLLFGDGWWAWSETMLWVCVWHQTTQETWRATPWNDPRTTWVSNAHIRIIDISLTIWQPARCRTTSGSKWTSRSFAQRRLSYQLRHSSSTCWPIWNNKISHENPVWRSLSLSFLTSS